MKQKVTTDGRDRAGRIPGVENVMAFVGGGGPGGGGSNSGNMFIFLKPDAERQKTGDSAEVVINRLRPKTAGIPGVTLYLQSQQELEHRRARIGDAVSVLADGG